MKNKSLFALGVALTLISSNVQAGKKAAIGIGSGLLGYTLGRAASSNDSDCSCRHVERQLSRCENRLDRVQDKLDSCRNK